jgi:hypothetical protein
MTGLQRFRSKRVAAAKVETATNDGARYEMDRRGKLIAVETLPAEDAVSAPSKVKPKQGPKFVMTSSAQDRRLRQVTSATALHVFRRLQFLAPYGKARGKPFALPDAAVFGFNRDQRHRALIELGRCGLISAEPRRGTSPMITMLGEYRGE